MEVEEKSMGRVVQIPVAPLTEEGFRPYGELIHAAERPADFQGITTEGWKTAIEVDGPPMIMFLSSRGEGLRFTRLERHFGVTQTFIPMGSVPSLVAMAAPTDPDPAAIPAPEDVRGFLVDGSAGYVLKRGTWHSLDRFPLADKPSQIVIISALPTQEELETAPQDVWRLTQDVDYNARFGVTFEFSLD
jgi:ureidoglycolate hydrolase